MKPLFGKVNNLEGFIHPKFNREFEFMDEKQSVNLARRILDEFVKTNIKNILVIESGTSPLISIIKNLREFKNANLNLVQIKIPRDLDFNLFGWFKEYLHPDELESRKDILKELCENFSLEELIGNDKFSIYDSVKDTHEYNISTASFQKCLEGTELASILSNEFLVFDEYINAGTIIRNLNGMIKLFTDNRNYKLSSFCMFLDNPKSIDKIAFTLYDNSSELSCYSNGAYPFENRIDLIGYYFFIDQDNFVKVYLDDLKNDVKNKLSGLDVNNFFKRLDKLISDANLLEKLKNSITVEQVKNYVDNSDIIHFMLKDIDEYIFGKSSYSDFFDQVYELYAPAWSPMPVVNHLDYWNAFALIKDDIRKLYDDINLEYKSIRFDIINYVLDVLWINKHDYEMKVMEEMK